MFLHFEYVFSILIIISDFIHDLFCHEYAKTSYFALTGGQGDIRILFCKGVIPFSAVDKDKFHLPAFPVYFDPDGCIPCLAIIICIICNICENLDETFLKQINIIVIAKEVSNVMFKFLKKTMAVCMIGLGTGILLVLLLPIAGWLFIIGVTIVLVGLIWLAC